jgi:hypothetical protein
MTCAHCSAPTTRPRYCSRACCGAAKRQNCVCVVCGVTFRRTAASKGRPRACCGSACVRVLRRRLALARYAQSTQAQQRTAAVVAALRLPEPEMTIAV